MEPLKSNGPRYRLKVSFGESVAPIAAVHLATSKQEAMCYGDVLLEVAYEPNQMDENGVPWDNYFEGCWQFRVYKPIPIVGVRRMYEAG